MDVFRAMQVFVATVRVGSMSGASKGLGISAAMVGQHIAALEKRLGARLLNRTTRSQSLTDFGESYFQQCLDILGRVAAAEEDAQTLHAAPRGRLRITAPVTFGSEILAPAIARYKQHAPNVELDVILTDRDVDLVEEGVDVAIRIGRQDDSSMIARPLAPYRMIICAAPAYLEQAGSPTHPSDLAKHQTIRFAQTSGPWFFEKENEICEVSPPTTLQFNNGRAIWMAARAGLGLIMQPALLLEGDVAARRMVRVLADWRIRERPMYLLYYRDRQMTPRLRSFITFATQMFGPQ